MKKAERVVGAKRALPPPQDGKLPLSSCLGLEINTERWRILTNSQVWVAWVDGYLSNIRRLVFRPLVG